MRTVRGSVVALVVGAGTLALPTVAGAGGGADDQDVAEESLLTVDDLSLESDVGAVLEESEYEPNEIPNDRECRPVVAAERLAAKAADAAIAFSESAEEFVVVEQQVLVFRRASDARKYMGNVSDVDAGECLGSAFLEILDSPDADLAIEDSDLGGGDDSVGYFIEATEETATEILVNTYEPVYLRVGRSVTYLGFYDVSSGGETVVDTAVELLEDAVAT